MYIKVLDILQLISFARPALETQTWLT